MPAHSHHSPMQDIVALDVGTVRIGVARASTVARIAEPLTTLTNNDEIWKRILELLEQYNAACVVVGLPRGLEGQETAQTAYVRQFIDRLSDIVGVPVVLQDEALTSRKAEAELEERGKAYAKGEVDALAAAFILEDFLAEHHGKI